MTIESTAIATTSRPTTPHTLASMRHLMHASLSDSSTEGENEVRTLLHHWLGVDPATLPGFSDSYYGFLQINVQAALDAFLAEPGRESAFYGIDVPSAKYYEQVPFSRLLSPPTIHWGGAVIGLVDYRLRPSGPGEYMSCLDRGIVLFRDAECAGAIWIDHNNHWDTPVTLEIITSVPERAATLIDELRSLSEKHSPYKGKMFTIRSDKLGFRAEFMSRPQTTADELILPDGLLKKISRHTIAVARKRKQLKKLGMHLKRGILLHGPPGTGKTHTIRYLAAQMPESTFMILPKQSVGIAHVLMKWLEPAVVVLDDVDLVAEDRALPGMASRNLLFEMLEALDGLNDTDDVLFVLTTNRVDTMEPAIAARPGRVDQSIEIPRPDDAARRKLFELYARHVDLRVDPGDVDKVLEQTQGVTASFFKELLRRAQVAAVKDGEQAGADGRVAVTADRLFAALDGMLDPTNPMTRLLLGADDEESAAALLAHHD